jgi:hypothetical protein
MYPSPQLSDIVLCVCAQLSPFTDLDSSASDLSAKWKASKSALVLLMRSWVGVVQLSADEMAWPTLVRMLKDPKVSRAPLACLSLPHVAAEPLHG